MSAPDTTPPAAPSPEPPQPAATDPAVDLAIDPAATDPAVEPAAVAAGEQVAVPVASPVAVPVVAPVAEAGSEPVAELLPVAVTEPTAFADGSSDTLVGPSGRRLPKAVGVALAVVGLLAVTAAGATVTVAVGKPDGTRHTVAAASSPSASATTSTPSPSAAATTSAPPSPTPVPTPSSTIHGTVDGSKHGGDIRYFLLPMPDGAESYGSADGVTLDTGEITKLFTNASEMKSILNSYGYQDDAAERRYRTRDGSQEVVVRLMRFSSHSNARQFAAGIRFEHGDSFSIPGDGDAQAILLKPDQEAWTGEMVGVSSVGDIEYEVKVYVKGTPDKALLIDAMKRQRERLGSGG